MIKFVRASMERSPQIQAEMEASLKKSMETNVDLASSLAGKDIGEIIKKQLDEDSREVYINNLYQVIVQRDDRALPPDGSWPKMIWLSIRRLDREPIRDWRQLQLIKNELVGPEHEAIELFPAESRLVDSANQYHLWVLADVGVRFPFGFIERFVTDSLNLRNSKQRPLGD